MTFTARIISFNLQVFGFAFHFTDGALLIPVVFFIQNIVTESYGYINSQKMLRTSLIIFLIFVLINMFISYILTQNAYTTVINTLPRHTISFIIALYIGGTINNLILYKLKRFFNQNFLAMRFIASTIVGEFIFQTIAITLSWYGVYNFHNLIPLFIIPYTYKILFEILMTPFNILICRNVKKLILS